MDTMIYRYPSGMTVTYRRDEHGNLRVIDYDMSGWGKGGTSAAPVGIVQQSPFTRRAIAGKLPGKLLR